MTAPRAGCLAWDGINMACRYGYAKLENAKGSASAVAIGIVLIIGFSLGLIA